MRFVSIVNRARRVRVRQRRARTAWIALSISLAVGLACDGGDDPLEAIRELQQEGRVDESVLRLRELLQKDPDRPEIQLYYGQTLAQLGELSLAIWPLREAASAPEFAVDAGVLLAHSLLRMQNANDAIAALDRVLAVDPEHARALELRARSLLDANRQLEALEDIERLQALEPDHPGALLSKTVALLGLERADEAGEVLRAARERIAADPDEGSPQMHARLCLAEATFTAEKGEPERGEEMVDACLAEYPADPLLVSESVGLYERVGKGARALEILRRALEEAPEEMRFRDALATRLRASGEVEEAEQLLLEATQGEAPVDGWIRLYDHYSDLEDYEAARAALERVFELLDDPPPVLRLAYGDMLVLLGEHRRALAIAEELSPVHANMLRGRSYLAQGDAARALEALREGVRLWPNSATGRWLAGQAAERVGEFEEALSHYREALRADIAKTDAALRGARLYAATGRDAEALDFVARYVRAHADDPEGHLLLLRIADRLDRKDAMRHALTGLGRLPGQSGRALAERAALLAATAGPEEAVALIEDGGLDLDEPEHAVALEAWAEYVRALGAAERAFARVDAALVAHPEIPAFHLIRAQLLRASGRPPEVVQEVFERSLELDPQNSEASIGLAQLLAEQGEVERALALYDGVDSAAPNAAAAAYAAAQLLVELERPERAEQRLATLLDAHPTHAQAASDLARLLVTRGGEPERAEELARRAVLLLAGPESFETLGQIQLERGESRAAVETLTQAVERYPGSATVRYQLGLALLASGDASEARDALRSALDSGSFPEADRARAELARLEEADAQRP